jgi:hypothetical protein
VPALVTAKPANSPRSAPFSTVLEILKGDRAALAKLTMPDLEKVLAAARTLNRHAGGSPSTPK